MKEWRIAEQWQRLHHAAACAQYRIALVGNDDPGVCPCRDVIDDLIGQIMHIDDGLGDTGGSQLVQHMIEQRLAGNLHQRLRHGVGQRPHAQTKTSGEDHGFGRN